MTSIADVESFGVVGYDRDAERKQALLRDASMGGTRLEIGMASCRAARAADSPGIRAITEALAAQALARPLADGPYDNGSAAPAVGSEWLDLSPHFEQG